MKIKKIVKNRKIVESLTTQSIYDDIAETINVIE